MAGNGSGFRDERAVGLLLLMVVMGDGENRLSGSMLRGGDLRYDCSIRDGDWLCNGLCLFAWAII